MASDLDTRLWVEERCLYGLGRVGRRARREKALCCIDCVMSDRRITASDEVGNWNLKK